MGLSFSGETKELWEAASSGDATKLRPLAEKLGSKPKALNCPNPKSDDQTALHVACEKNQPRCVHILAALSGVDVNQVDKLGRTAVFLACAKGNFDCVKELTSQSNCDINKCDKDGSSPLWAAACAGHIDVVMLLTQLPAIDVNKESSYGLLNAKEKKATAKNKTPIYAAAANGHTEVVRALSAHPKIDINKKTWDGRTPIAAANKEEIKAILREKGSK